MIYLNNAATSFPKPGEVVAAVVDTLAVPPRESGRGGDGTANDVLAKCWRELAMLTGTTPAAFVFTSGTKHALNLAILVFRYRAEKHDLLEILEDRC